MILLQELIIYLTLKQVLHYLPIRFLSCSTLSELTVIVNIRKQIDTKQLGYNNEVSKIR